MSFKTRSKLVKQRKTNLGLLPSHVGDKKNYRQRSCMMWLLVLFFADAAACLSPAKREMNLEFFSIPHERFKRFLSFRLTPSIQFQGKLSFLLWKQNRFLKQTHRCRRREEEIFHEKSSINKNELFWFIIDESFLLHNEISRNRFLKKRKEKKKERKSPIN